jgi:hypothetical protein
MQLEIKLNLVHALKTLVSQVSVQKITVPTFYNLPNWFKKFMRVIANIPEYNSLFLMIHYEFIPVTYSRHRLLRVRCGSMSRIGEEKGLIDWNYGAVDGSFSPWQRRR